MKGITGKGILVGLLAGVAVGYFFHAQIAKVSPIKALAGQARGFSQWDPSSFSFNQYRPYGTGGL
jgi:hypothetical protein